MGIRNVLVVNAGSSSLKFMLFDMEAEKMLAKGQVERIGIDNPLFTFTTGDYSEKQTLCEAPNHTAAIKLVCNALVDPAKGGCLKSFADIDAVGHRMVHGGELYSGSVLLTPEVLEAFEKLSPLARRQKLSQKFTITLFQLRRELTKWLQLSLQHTTVNALMTL